MTSDDPTPQILKLPEVLDLNAASRLYEQVLAHKGNDIELDASEVKRVGAQCIQILLSAVNSWQADRQQFKVSNASESYIKTLQLMGISNESLFQKEILK